MNKGFKLIDRFAVLILYKRSKGTKRRENEYILYVTAVMTKNMNKNCEEQTNLPSEYKDSVAKKESSVKISQQLSSLLCIVKGSPAWCIDITTVPMKCRLY